MTQNQPALDPGQVSIRINLEVPNGLFHAPQIQASIVIPESAANQEPLSAEVQDNVRELIQQNTGLEIRLLVEHVAAEG